MMLQMHRKNGNSKYILINFIAAHVFQRYEALNYFQDLIGKKNKFITNATIQSNKEHINFLNKKIRLYKKNNYKKVLMVFHLSRLSLAERSYSLDLINIFKLNKINFRFMRKILTITIKFIKI